MIVRSDRRGFSLVEMAIVLVVFGIALAMGLPALHREMSTWSLHDSGRIVAGELRLARQKAVTNQQVNWVWFAPSFNGYWTKQGADAWKGPFMLPSRVTVQTPNFSGSNFTWFSPDGRAGLSGSVVLINDQAQTETVNLDLSGAVWR